MRTPQGITSNCEQLRNEQYYYDPMAPPNSQGVVQPMRTMIRSLDTLRLEGSGSNSRMKSGGVLTDASGDPVEGWAPEVEILSEAELKRLEKQEDREQRMRKRRR